MTIHKLSPILWTNDLGATIQFYETVLGFKSKSNFPNFVSLTKGPVEIMFIVPQNEVGRRQTTAELSCRAVYISLWKTLNLSGVLSSIKQ